MAAPVQPETPTQEQNQQQSQEQNQQQQTEQQAQGSQTQSTTEPSRAERLLGLYEENMRAAHQRASQLQQELDRRDRAAQDAQNNAPPQVPEITASEFWNKPLPHIAQIIRDETRKAVQPLYEFKQQVENQNKYDGLKGRFKNDPRYKDIFPKIENIVDQMIQQSGAEPTEALMNATILSAIGALHTGQLPGVTLDEPRSNGNTQGNQNQMGQQNSQAQDTRVITPPHLRPSAPNIQPQDTKPKLRDLTELEDRLRRENNMTKEEFIQWMDLPAHEVAHAKIGKAPPPDQNQNNQSQVQRIANPNAGQGR